MSWTVPQGARYASSPAVAAERGILGGILVDDKALVVAADKIQPDDFFDRRHGTIFAAMQSLAAAHQPVELVTLVEPWTPQCHSQKRLPERIIRER
jgi:replicative DNA helicase